MLRTRDSSTRAGDVAGGYPLLRKLGEGERAEVFLASADEGVAVKVYRPSTPFASIDAELDCLSRAEHAHVVHVRDVSTTCLVLERLELGSLAHLLAARRSIALGEALTILAPLGAALDALHTSGVVHSAVRASSVLFRASGAPVLACFGRASLAEPGRTLAALAGDPLVIADRDAFARMAQSVLERVPFDRRVRAIGNWLDEQSRAGFPDPVGEELADRLFDLIDPQPVRFVADASDLSDASSPTIPARAVAPAEVVAPHEPALARGLGLPSWVGEALESSPLTLLRSHLAGVRRPVWMALAVVAVALGAAVLLVPDDEPVGAPQPVASASVAPDAPGASSASVSPPSPVSVDDPLEAVPLLLAAREGCVRELSIQCLDAVDQAGSAAMSTDAELIQSIVDGTEPPIDALFATPDVTLVDRLGDSALVSLGDVPKTQPASLLLVKGEAGWRIRGYMFPG